MFINFYIARPTYCFILIHLQFDIVIKRIIMLCYVLFFSSPRSEGWPHHGRTFIVHSVVRDDKMVCSQVFPSRSREALFQLH